MALRRTLRCDGPDLFDSTCFNKPFNMVSIVSSCSLSVAAFASFSAASSDSIAILCALIASSSCASGGMGMRGKWPSAFTWVTARVGEVD